MKYVVALVVVLCSTIAFSQNKPSDKSALAQNYEKAGSFCGNSERKSIDEILRMRPYDKIASIKLVSFKKLSDHSEHLMQIPQTNGKVDMSKMFEQKILTPAQRNRLFDVLVNYNDNKTVHEVLLCYEPRNAIIFLNDKDDVLGYIEFCFECWQLRGQFYNLEFTEPMGTFCKEKLDVIQGFFLNAGIKYGARDTEKE